MKDKGQNRSIITDKEFDGARRVLDAKRKELRKQGKGRKEHALTQHDEDVLWSTNQLGDHSPAVLLRTVWFFNTMHFGWRGSDENCRTCLGDFHISKDENGTEFVEFCTERGTKTRTGAEWQQERAFNPCMYATGTDRCPVKYFKKYVSLRTDKAQSPFYLAVTNAPDSRVWYKNQPLGVNTLSEL